MEMTPWLSKERGPISYIKYTVFPTILVWRNNNISSTQFQCNGKILNNPGMMEYYSTQVSSANLLHNLVWRNNLFHDSGNRNESLTHVWSGGILINPVHNSIVMEYYRIHHTCPAWWISIKQLLQYPIHLEFPNNWHPGMLHRAVPTRLDCSTLCIASWYLQRKRKFGKLFVYKQVYALFWYNFGLWV